MRKDDANYLDGKYSHVMNVVTEDFSYMIILGFSGRIADVLNQKMNRNAENQKEKTGAKTGKKPSAQKERAAVLALGMMIYDQMQRMLSNLTTKKVRVEPPLLIEEKDYLQSEKTKLRCVSDDLREGANIVIPFETISEKYFVRVWFPTKYKDYLLGHKQY